MSEYYNGLYHQLLEPPCYFCDGEWKDLPSRGVGRWVRLPPGGEFYDQVWYLPPDETYHKAERSEAFNPEAWYPLWVWVPLR